MINIVGTPLNQWDVGRLVQVTGEASHVHFANQGDSVAPIIDIVDGEAKIPDYLLQTGKTLFAYTVLNGVTLERVSFSVRKRERPENYVYEDDRRNYIYELIADAQAATVAANQAAQDILAAKDRGEFNGPKGDPLLIIDKASGTEITMSDAEKHAFIDMHIFGKTTQDGAPTPDAPVDLVSVGDSGSITVSVAGKNDAQSMTIATPNGLPGIPVTEGGNYTDANGQQWVCDEIDLARGIFIKRVAAETLSGSPDFREASDWPGRFVYGGFLQTMYKDGNQMSFSNFAKWRRWALGEPGGSCFAVTSKLLYYYPATTMTETEVNELFAEMIASETPPVILAQLATPIEIPLSDEEIAAYAALRTYRDHTTVTNDASAHMELEYVLDAKKYIDSLVTGGIVPATVE